MFVLWAVELAESFLEILIVEEKIKIYFLKLQIFSYKNIHNPGTKEFRFTII